MGQMSCVKRIKAFVLSGNSSVLQLTLTYGKLWLVCHPLDAYKTCLTRNLSLSDSEIVDNVIDSGKD